VSSNDIVLGSNEDEFRGVLQTLVVYLLNTRASVASFSDENNEPRVLRNRASSFDKLTSSSASYWQQKGYKKVASLDKLEWDIISRSSAYFEESHLPQLEVALISYRLFTTFSKPPHSLQINVASSQSPTFTLSVCNVNSSS